MTRYLAVVMIMSGVCSCVEMAAPYEREREPNLVGVEVLGRGYLASVQVERYLGENVSLGLGAGYFERLIIPSWLAFTSGGRLAWYSSAGGSVAIPFEPENPETTTFPASFTGTLASGVQYANDWHGVGRLLFMMHLTTTNQGELLLLPWIGLSLSGTFGD